MLEDNLYWAIVHTRWMDEANFARGPSTFFSGVPAPARPIVKAMVRRQVRNYLWSQGLGRHASVEILAIAAKDIESLAAILGEKPYLMGQKPSGGDASAFAFAA